MTQSYITTYSITILYYDTVSCPFYSTLDSLWAFLTPLSVCLRQRIIHMMLYYHSMMSWLLISSLTPRSSTNTGEHLVSVASPGIWCDEMGGGGGEWNSVTGCVVRNQSSLTSSSPAPPSPAPPPPQYHHLERMPETGLVAELDSRAIGPLPRWRGKSWREKGHFAVHACLSSALALRSWTAARSADVDCPAPPQDNIHCCSSLVQPWGGERTSRLWGSVTGLIEKHRLQGLASLQIPTRNICCTNQVVQYQQPM